MKAKMYNLVNHVEQDELDAGLLAEHYSVEISDGKGMTLPAAFSSDCLLYTSPSPRDS